MRFWVVRAVWLFAGLTALWSCGEEVVVAGLPVANAGFDLRVKTGNSVILDGRGSKDPNGEDIEFSWELVARPLGSMATLAGLTTDRPSFDTDASGVYLISLTVSNASRTSEPDLVAVTASNVGPTAVVACRTGSSCMVLHGRTEVLRGSDSIDGDGDMLSYTWTQVTDPMDCATRCPSLMMCNPTAQTAVFADPNSANTNFTAPDDKGLELVFHLEVTDGDKSDTACLTYTTFNTAPINGLAMSTMAAVDDVTGTFTLSAFTGDSDPGDQALLTYSWVQINPTMPLASFADATMEMAMVTAPDVTSDTTFQFQLTVSDGVDMVTGSPVSVIIRDVN